MAQQEYFRRYETPEQTIIEWQRQLNHLLNNLSNGSYVTIDPNTIKASMIDFGVGADQVDASDIPITDTNNYYIGTNIELALQELGFALTTLTGTSTLTIAQKGVVLCNSAGGFALNLPTAIGNSKIIYSISNINTGTITITPFGTEKIEGDSSFPLYHHMLAVNREKLR